MNEQPQDREAKAERDRPRILTWDRGGGGGRGGSAAAAGLSSVVAVEAVAMAVRRGLRPGEEAEAEAEEKATLGGELPRKEEGGRWPEEPAAPQKGLGSSLSIRRWREQEMGAAAAAAIIASRVGAD